MLQVSHFVTGATFVLLSLYLYQSQPLYIKKYTISMIDYQEKYGENRQKDTRAK